MLTKAAPILQAINLSETQKFFRVYLGFQAFHFGDYLVLSKDRIEIHYVQLPAGKALVPASCYICDDNIADLFTAFSATDLVHPKNVLKTNSRGKLEFTLTDNNGNHLVFCEC